MTADKRPPGQGYAKPVVVPDGLESLTGPTTGVVVLPPHLKWSGSSRYDLGQPGRIVDLYRTVLNEAATPEDLSQYLDRSTLLALWPTMWLPAALRRRWEDRFPELGRRRHDPAA
ncbi:hypothetical protein Ade02nite_72200 [Paractinoplanes deccanensis]|uniref:Transcriptional regulator n=1 Tax=Paractinoplanes deccanensis TaxID=113561 RepID=A0ABQ3YF02_9ACTN|nr:hypothetical protein [Actinoplanes deccanensis]GID78579.1 hypothetical protein Ade02nite_72200 [Actinoplanes deccanensis]